MANDDWNDELFCVLKLWDKTIRYVFDQLRIAVHPSGPNSKTLRKKEKNLARTGGETWDKISAVNICGVSPSEEQSCHILNKICVRERDTFIVSIYSKKESSSLLLPFVWVLSPILKKWWMILLRDCDQTCRRNEDIQSLSQKSIVVNLKFLKTKYQG